MPESFFDRPILTSPYEYPARHWELDAAGQPTERIVESRRRAELITSIPGPKKRRRGQKALVYDEGQGLSTEAQQYEATSTIINELRARVDRWRELPNPNDWLVTPETARLLEHWRHHRYQSIRPFFCQVERELDVPLALPIAEEDGGPGFRGEADGVAAELRIERGECIDSMSGVRFTARAQVWLDGAPYPSGCGHYLFD